MTEHYVTSVNQVPDLRSYKGRDGTYVHVDDLLAWLDAIASEAEAGNANARLRSIGIRSARVCLGFVLRDEPLVQQPTKRSDFQRDVTEALDG